MFPGWPYKKIHDNVVRNHVQQHIDQLHSKYANQHKFPQSPVGSDMDVEEEGQNGPPPAGSAPPFDQSGSSESD